MYNLVYGLYFTQILQNMAMFEIDKILVSLLVSIQRAPLA
jgi:hypothetical protein